MIKKNVCNSLNDKMSSTRFEVFVSVFVENIFWLEMSLVVKYLLHVILKDFYLFIYLASIHVKRSVIIYVMNY